MERKQIKITERGSYKFEDNYELFFKDEDYLDYCNITCGGNCIINCGWCCNITCGNDCKIVCACYCNIISGNNSEIICGFDCYIKTGEGSELKIYDLLKKISEDEQFIWWYNNDNWNLINTFEDEEWKNKNLDKWEKWYGFVHNELDSATLF